MDLPLKLLEGLLLLGLVLGFAWWQLRSIRIDQTQAAARQQDEREADSSTATGRQAPGRADDRDGPDPR